MSWDSGFAKVIEAVVARAQATGTCALLDVLIRHVDHVATVLGLGEGQRRGYRGHEQLLPLVRLARMTGEAPFLDLARFFVDQRRRSPTYLDEMAARDDREPRDFRHGTHEYNRSNESFRDQRRVVGHA